MKQPIATLNVKEKIVFLWRRYERSKILSPGVDYWGRKHDEFESIFYGHKCSKNYEIGKIREEIYSRAQKASDNIYNTGGHKINFLIKKAGQVFDEIADEYRNMKCPFYKKVLTNENQ